WKLAFVEKEFAEESILDTYNEERLPVAKKLVETTDRLFNLIASGKKISIFLREYIVPQIIKQIVTHKKTGRFFFRTISQIGISYHHSPLLQTASVGKFAKKTPQPGDRLPYVFFDKEGKKINIQTEVKS